MILKEQEVIQGIATLLLSLPDALIKSADMLDRAIHPSIGSGGHFVMVSFSNHGFPGQAGE
jgi:hypothetical protein